MLADSAATNLSAVLTATAARWPDQEAIVFEGTRLTWRALAQQVDNLAAAFIALGIERGDCIGIQCTTRPEYIITYLAAMRCGAILAGFNSQYTPLEVSRLAVLARPAVLVLQADAAARLQPFMPSLTSVRHTCLLYTSDAADERSSVDLGGPRIIQKKKDRL